VTEQETSHASGAATPEDEWQRLRALLRTELLDTAPEPAFDHLTELASALCGTPIALFSLVDSERQWFKSRVGLEACETPRGLAFCAYAMLGDEVMEVPDATADPRFAANALVTGEPHIRFYAGVPVRAESGQPLGTLCVIDTVPRELTPAQREHLARLASLCSSLVHARQQRRSAERRERTLAHLLDVMPEGVVACDAEGELSLFNATARSWHGADPRKLTQDEWARHFNLYAADGSTLLEPDQIPLVRAFRGERISEAEICIQARGQQPRYVLCTGAPLLGSGGEADGAIVVMRDITVRRQAKQALEAERARLQMVLDGTRAGTWEWNVQTGETRFNARWAEIVGYTLEELAPISIETWTRLAHPDDLADSGEQLQAHFRGERDYYDMLCRMRHKAGHWVWVHDRGRVMSRDADGQPLWMAGTHLEVTEMKAAQQATERARAELASLIDGSEDVSIIATDPDGTIRLFNPGAQRLLGYRAEELVGRHTPQLIHLRDEVEQRGRELSAERGREISGFEVFVDGARRGQAESRQWTYVRKDGEHRQVRLAVSAIRAGEDDEITGFVGIAIDLTALLNESAARNESEERFRGAFESSALGLALVSLQGRWLQVNPAVCQMLGYSREELLATDFQTITHPDDLNIDLELLGQVLAGKLPNYQLRKRYISKQGALVWGLLAVSLVRDERGAPLYFVSQIQDITTRVRAEEALRASEAKLSELFRLSPIGIALHRADTGAFVEANPEFHRVLGYSEDEFRRVDSERLLALEGSDEDARQKELLEVVGRYGPYEKELLRADGARLPVLTSGVRFMGPDGRALVLSVVQDISERKRLERMKSEFVSTVSHELRTPLTSIYGGLGLVMGGALGEVPESMREMLELAHRNAERLNLLIADLLDLEKLMAGKMSFERSPHSLRALLVDSLASLQGYAERFDVALELGECADEELLLDPARFDQIIANLVSNAIKFSPPGGRVEIECSRLDHALEIRVLDRGSGVPEGFRPRLFETFAQANSGDERSQQGTGLGLAITRQLTERMGGQVGYLPRAGGGSCFWLQFPTGPRGRPQPRQQVSETRPRVLVVEDDPDVATVLIALLEREGFAASSAADPAEARAAIERHEFCALTLDLGLGDADGRQLLKELRADPLTAALPVLVISGEPNAGRGLRDPASQQPLDFLAKPLNPADLADSMRRLMRQVGEPMPARILHVEDDPMLRSEMARAAAGFAQVESASTLEQARMKLRRDRFDLVVLDLVLPDGDGMDLVTSPPSGLPPVLVYSRHALSPDRSLHIAAALLKQETSPAKLEQMLRALLRLPAPNEDAKP
jgi:PAS domain S-box-containing protein